MKYGENAWAGVKGYLDEVTERTAAPVIAKYTGVLAAADIEIFTRTTSFAIMQSLRLDRGPAHRSTPEQNPPGPVNAGPGVACAPPQIAADPLSNHISMSITCPSYTQSLHTLSQKPLLRGITDDC